MMVMMISAQAEDRIRTIILPLNVHCGGDGGGDDRDRDHEDAVTRTKVLRRDDEQYDLDHIEVSLVPILLRWRKVLLSSSSRTSMKVELSLLQKKLC